MKPSEKKKLTFIISRVFISLFIIIWTIILSIWLFFVGLIMFIPNTIYWLLNKESWWKTWGWFYHLSSLSPFFNDYERNKKRIKNEKTK